MQRELLQSTGRKVGACLVSDARCLSQFGIINGRGKKRWLGGAKGSRTLPSNRNTPAVGPSSYSSPRSVEMPERLEG